MLMTPGSVSRGADFMRLITRVEASAGRINAPRYAPVRGVSARRITPRRAGPEGRARGARS